mmetsp:Transcript_16237/g.35253  ORF Transcript_16237/g.35253 Transcript_16237/m.35253 type:complete len:121 (-) Transcript_16237:120-482(-)
MDEQKWKRSNSEKKSTKKADEKKKHKQSSAKSEHGSSSNGDQEASLLQDPTPVSTSTTGSSSSHNIRSRSGITFEERTTTTGVASSLCGRRFRSLRNTSLGLQRSGSRSGWSALDGRRLQ